MTDGKYDDLNPKPRLLMGPGPINADPRVLRAMSAQLLGQFDPQFRGYMKEVSALYRGVFQTQNRWTLLIDGTARSAIEAALASLSSDCRYAAGPTNSSTLPKAPASTPTRSSRIAGWRTDTFTTSSTTPNATHSGRFTPTGLRTSGAC